MHQAFKPTFKGSECPSRFFVLRALHTTRRRGQCVAEQQVMELDTIHLLNLLVISP